MYKVCTRRCALNSFPPNPFRICYRLLYKEVCSINCAARTYFVVPGHCKLTIVSRVAESGEVGVVAARTTWLVVKVSHCGVVEGGEND